MKTRISISSFILFTLFSCNSSNNENQSANATSEQVKTFTKTDLFYISAIEETDPAVAVGNDDDAADDPAIWIHPTTAKKSLIFGSNKKAGIEVYALTGERLNFFPVGLINNIDVLQDLIINKDTLSILGGSNRTENTIDIYRIVGADSLIQIVSIMPQIIREVYGFCFFQNPDNNKNYAVVNGKSGAIEQYEIKVDSGKLNLNLVRKLQAPSQVEGMVADPELNRLYVGVEEAGIMIFTANPEGGEKHTWIKGSTAKNPNISYDIEGLALFKTKDKKYLLASSQGNNTFSIFKGTKDNEYLGSFQVILGEDTIQDTDGIEVASRALGPKYPNGIFICQDGYNKDDLGKSTPQNFKYVDWREVENIINQLSKN